ncbi:MAG: monovalent cation/H(+) antiporter subunit G [Pseudomonadota bacterium]|mgnify:FL=1|nr:monovalent cation/H(+) antiporter subunit G [Pseudomonadota bacterium]
MINFSSIIDLLSWVLILGGSFFVLLGTIGFYRFPDFWSRLHAASILDSGGVILLICGMCLQAGFSLVSVKLIFILFFLLVTGPAATHAIANAALVSGLKANKKEQETKRRSG